MTDRFHTVLHEIRRRHITVRRRNARKTPYRGANCFQSTLNPFRRGANCFQNTLNPFCRGANCFQNTLNLFRRGANRFRNIPTEIFTQLNILNNIILFIYKL